MGCPDFNHGGRRERARINCAHYHLRPCSPFRGAAFSRVSLDAFSRLQGKKGARPWRVRPGDELPNAVIHAVEGVEAGFPTLTPDRVPVGTKTDYFSWISVTVQFYTRAKINLDNPPAASGLALADPLCDLHDHRRNFPMIVPSRLDRLSGKQ